MAVVAAACAPLVFVGCGDDNGTAPAVDGSAEGGMDATMTPDSPVGMDATQDRGTADAPADRTAEAGGDSQAEAGICALVDAGPLDDASVAAGMNSVANVYRCWRCHQDKAIDAGGLTLSGRSTSLVDGGAIFPPNLTPDMTGLGCWTDPQIMTAMLDGFDIHDAGLCVMPKFGHIMDDAGTEPMDAATAEQIIQFLRTLPPVSNVVQMTVCPAPSDGGGGGDSGDAGGGDGGGTNDSGDAGATGDSGSAGDAAAEASGDDGGDSGEGGD